MTGRYERLDPADRFFCDVLRVTDPAGFVIFEDVDMTATRDLIAGLRGRGVRITYTHAVVRATALAFARHPRLNKVIAGNRVGYPDGVTLSMSVRGDGTSLGDEPNIVLPAADTLELPAMAAEITRRATELRADLATHRNEARRVVRMVPVGFLRRFLIRKMKARLPMIEEKLGIFHITSVPNFRYAAPFVYPGIGVLAINRVADAVVAENGRPVVRPIGGLGMVGDHRVWKAHDIHLLLHEIKQILQSGELAAELPTTEPAWR